MSSIGASVHELHINDRNTTWRIIYRIDDDAIVIADVFSKKTRSTPRQVIHVCQQRLSRYDEIVGGSSMEQAKRDKLEGQGWKVGSVADFLGLSREEAEYLEVKLALSHQVRQRRQQQGLTQEAVAHLSGSSQSRVAKMEAGDPSVSIDLLIKTLIALGASRHDIADTIGAATA